MTLAHHSLRKQVSLRFLAVFVIIGGITTGLFWLAWDLANERLVRTTAENTVRAVEERLDTLTAGWQQETNALATQITFNRMLEHDDLQRWPVLQAYLEALGENLGFPGLVIVDKRGRPVFELGALGTEFANHLRRAVRAPEAYWYPGHNPRGLSRVTPAPLWLGLHGGHGQLLTLAPLDNHRLASLATPESAVKLLLRDVVVASSAGNRDVGLQTQAAGPHAHGPHPGGWALDIPLGAADYRLRVEHHLPALISPNQFALTGIALVMTLALGLFAVFGDWFRRNIRRIERMSGQVEHFRTTHSIDAETPLDPGPEPASQDELTLLEQALLDLMHTSLARDEENRAYLQTLEILEEAVVELDWQGRLLRHSPAWEKLMGADAPRDSFLNCLDPEDRETLQHQISELFSGAKTQVSARLRVASPQRAGTWLECRFVPADDPVTRIRGVLRDVTQTYLQERHITHMALHDALTRLPNRILLEDRIKLALRMATREQHKVALGFIDLDHFKNVNDVLGHKFGDKLLVHFAENLRHTLRSADTLARWGGDEFVVLLPSLESTEDIHRVAEKLVQSSREAMQIEGQTVPVTFSMGFSIFPDDGDNMEVLLSQADRAMFYAKAQGRNTVQFFSDMTRKGLGKKELYIQSKLSAAITQQRIQTWFQPLVDGKTGLPIGLEALARWQDPELGWIPPATFIPMAENLGLIAELGDLVMAHTLTMGRRMLDNGHDLLLSVNISKRQLYLPDCTERLLRDTRIAGIAPGRVMLEITESVAMSEVDYAMERLRSLHAAGFKLAIDDFGVGYSSLSQLHEMPVHELKIDLSFTRRVLDPQGSQLIQAIVGMADALGLTTVAEGVENADTAARLVALGVHTLQGYHFGKPMPESDFEAWLDAQTAAS